MNRSITGLVQSGDKPTYFKLPSQIPFLLNQLFYASLKIFYAPHLTASPSFSGTHTVRIQLPFLEQLQSLQVELRLKIEV
jgi:hypothetical protein